MEEQGLKATLAWLPHPRAFPLNMLDMHFAESHLLEISSKKVTISVHKHLCKRVVNCSIKTVATMQMLRKQDTVKGWYMMEYYAVKGILCKKT